LESPCADPVAKFRRAPPPVHDVDPSPLQLRPDSSPG